MRLLTALGCTGCAAVLAACSTPPDRRASEAPLPTAESVDLDRYLGLWHEIARYDVSFEEGCEGVTAEYTRREDGLIGVVNTCRNAAGDVTDRAEGRARVVNAPRNSKLEVSFFGPFFGDYWIVELAEDYSWAVISEPEGRYLWILARDPFMDAETLQARLENLRALGYDTDALHYTMQPPDDPQRISAP